MELFSIKPFEYLMPETINEILLLLKEKNYKSKIIAGGTELVVYLKTGKLSPERIIDISNVQDLDFIKRDEKLIRIGSLTTHHNLVISPLIKKNLYALSEAAYQVGTTQVRNIGTIGGNIVNASPAADTVTPLLSFEAQLKIVSTSNVKIIPIKDFFIHVNKTIINEDELLTEIAVPFPSKNTGTAFMKIGRKTAHDCSVLNAAVNITLNKETCSKICIAIGSAAPTPIRIRKAEEFLKNKILNEENIIKTSEIASNEISPISDIRADKCYRTEVSKVLVNRVIKKAIERARG